MKTYTGKQEFNRDQLVFVSEAILCGALDRIECGLPDVIPWRDRMRITVEPGDLSSYEVGGIECAGMALAVLYANLTDDGLGIGDALTCAGNFLEACEKFVHDAWKDEGKAFQARQKKAKMPCHVSAYYGKHYPDTEKHAKKFVSKCFKEYLS